MILPTKRLTENRALLVIGGEILQSLKEPKTISRLWAELNRHKSGSPLAFDWFVLALDLLYTLKSIELNHGLITKAQK
jgi:hypothetical protein